MSIWADGPVGALIGALAGHFLIDRDAGAEAGERRHHLHHRR